MHGLTGKIDDCARLVPRGEWLEKKHPWFLAELRLAYSLIDFDMCQANIAAGDSLRRLRGIPRTGWPYDHMM